MTIQPAPRTVTLTVHNIDLETITIPAISGGHGARTITRTTVKAQGDRWQCTFLAQPDERFCVGDQIMLDIHPPRQAGT